jgi:hypothetical protein
MGKVVKYPISRIWKSDLQRAKNSHPPLGDIAIGKCPLRLSDVNMDRTFLSCLILDGGKARSIPRPKREVQHVDITGTGQHFVGFRFCRFDRCAVRILNIQGVPPMSTVRSKR